MKRILKIFKFIAIGIFGLLLLASICLLLFYQSIYKETPLPAEVTVQPVLNKSLPMSGKPILLPIPKKMEWLSGHFNFPDHIQFKAPAEDVETILKIWKDHLGTDAMANVSGAIQFIKNKSIEPQAYNLSVNPDRIIVEYNDLRGLFYALTTLKQLTKQSNNQLPCVKIEDKPDLPTRGAMLDISRGKVPTLKTLCDMVDFLADLKYNQLQLYIEGFSFAYPTFKSLWGKNRNTVDTARN
jgi:hexosaminidase